MVGIVLILLALFVVGPIAIFFAGGIWSALIGWVDSDDADAVAENATSS